MPSKKQSGRSSSPRPSVALTKGDWLDVMDHDGVWNVARVLSVPSLEEVEVMYDGWPEEYDEVVRVDSDRVAPFHTFTWAVKCWVKYLNWPMWPSIITIRTPGTEEGIQNLAMENRLYVDFLDGPTFANRDRCWQKKRQVKAFDENYDRNRMGTNGAQFELALEYVLRSDATTKMPKFSRGTLPLQYDHLTTESVESMRKNMGNGLWYRNFANNKGRHIRTHVYEMIGDEEEVPSSDESALAEKLKVRRPLKSATVDESITPTTPKKKKRPLLTQTQQLSVKIEQESPAEVPYELEPIDSSDDSDSAREKEASLKKKRRLRAKARSVTSLVVIKSSPKKSKRSATSPDSNAASTMPRHVTVTMDEIIVDDDPDSDNSGIIPRKLVKKSHSEPAVSDDNDWEAEEKEVPNAIRKRVVRKDLASKKSVARRLSLQFSTRHRENEAALTKTQKSPKRSKPPASLIEQRIAPAQEALKLHEEKLRAAEDVLVLGQQKRGSDAVSGSSDRSPSSMPRAEKKESRTHQDQSAKVGSFLRVANSGVESLTGSELDGDRQAARFLKTRLDLGLKSGQVSHSFLSVDEAYSSDSQESKGVAAVFDDDVAFEFQSEPEPSPKMHADDAKAMSKDAIPVGSKQVAEEKGVPGDSEDESREVRRRFCVMRAGLEDTSLQMGQSDDEEERHEKQGFKRRPLYTVRQPPLIQPLRVSAFTQKTYSQLGIPPEDLAHEWVVLFKAITGGKMGEGMPLHIPDTVLLSPSGQPSVWYTTSASGRATEKDLMRVSPQAIYEAFRTPLSQHQCAANTKTLAAVRRLGFQVDTMSSRQLKVFCTDMEIPDIRLPLELAPTTSIERSELTKGAFCLQRYISCQNNASFLIVWRHSPVVSSKEQPGNTFITTQSALGGRDRGIHSTCHSKSTNIQRTPRAHSDVFLLTEAGLDVMSGDAQDSNYDAVEEAGSPRQAELMNPNSLIHLDIEHSESTTSKALRKSGFDPDVMAPLLFYMKRVTSEIANCINLGHKARQACGLACEFFISEHDRSVYFSALRGIQWVASAPSWELSRYVDPLSRSICEFYEGSSYKVAERSKASASPSRRSPKSHDRFTYYEQNPRFPSVHTPFAGDKQWLHRSQLLAPDISPRYIGASVPKIYRDGVFQSLLTAHQADSVVRLNLSPQAPSTLTEVRREQPHLSPRSISFRRKTTKTTTDTSSKAL